MKKILIIVDQPGWAFHKNSLALKKHCKDWGVDIFFGKESNYWILTDPIYKSIVEKFDLVLFFPDFRADVIEHNINVRPARFIVAIRSDVRSRGLAFYNNPELMKQKVGCFIVANTNLFLEFHKLHPFVRLASGGVDAETFKPKQRPMHDPPVVGWAGSRDNFGKKARGLDLIEMACERVGFPFKPAYREDRFRNEPEMVEYYQEIDIYVDMDLRAGRQGGLLEAGAMGLRLVSTPMAGIANQLIMGGHTGYLAYYNITSLCACLEWAAEDEMIGSRIREEVEKHWSWESQSKLFEDVFNEVVNSED